MHGCCHVVTSARKEGGVWTIHLFLKNPCCTQCTMVHTEVWGANRQPNLNQFGFGSGAITHWTWGSVWFEPSSWGLWTRLQTVYSSPLTPPPTPMFWNARLHLTIPIPVWNLAPVLLAYAVKLFTEILIEIVVRLFCAQKLSRTPM